MAHVVIFDRLAFQKTVLDDNGNPTIVPDGPEVVVAKGNRVPKWASLATISALESAGMIVPVADEAEPVIETVGPIAPNPLSPVPPPDAPNSTLTDIIDTPDLVADDDEFGPTAPVVTPPEPVAPKASDKRELWEDYAVASGRMTREDAQSYANKGDLIAALNEPQI